MIVEREKWYSYDDTLLLFIHRFNVGKIRALIYMINSVNNKPERCYADIDARKLEENSHKIKHIKLADAMKFFENRGVTTPLAKFTLVSECDQL